MFISLHLLFLLYAIPVLVLFKYVSDDGLPDWFVFLAALGWPITFVVMMIFVPKTEDEE